MQFSHLIFVGAKTWKTFPRALALLENAIARGIDVKTDCFASKSGATQINVVFPDWFLSQIPKVFHNKVALLRLRFEIQMMVKFLGFGYDDIQIAFANHEDFNKYNGKTISAIASLTKRSAFDILIEISKKSGGSARIFGHRYMNDQIIEELLKNKHALFMTDAWYEPEGLQNPALSGGFPRILQIIREKNLLPIEDAIHKMTGAVADRFALQNRGRIEKGYAADITVFDEQSIRDNTDTLRTNLKPNGIEYVFINGIKVYSENTVLKHSKSGQCLRN
jgi:N-acyl-D-amino-acid deacylase